MQGSQVASDTTLKSNLDDVTDLLNFGRDEIDRTKTKGLVIALADEVRFCLGHSSMY